MNHFIGPFCWTISLDQFIGPFCHLLASQTLAKGNHHTWARPLTPLCVARLRPWLHWLRTTVGFLFSKVGLNNKIAMKTKIVGNWLVECPALFLHELRMPKQKTFSLADCHQDTGAVCERQNTTRCSLFWDRSMRCFRRKRGCRPVRSNIVTPPHPNPQMLSRTPCDYQGSCQQALSRHV